MWKYTYEEVKEYIESFGCKLLSKKYIKRDVKLKIKCKCGNIFYVSFAKFKHRNKNRCNDCTSKKMSEKFSFSYEYVKNYIESNSKCIVLSKEYKNNNTVMSLECECGEVFEKRVAELRKGRLWCQKCTGKKKSEAQIFDISFISNEIKARGAKLITQKYTGAKQKLRMKCNCGSTFTSSWDSIKGRDVLICSSCMKRSSNYERKFRRILDKIGFEYIAEYVFEDCKNKKKLRFDFIVFINEKTSVLFEIDGQQHFFAVNFGYNKEKDCNFRRRIINDSIKNDYSFYNNITLKRIPYYMFEDFESLQNNVISYMTTLCQAAESGRCNEHPQGVFDSEILFEEAPDIYYIDDDVL